MNSGLTECNNRDYSSLENQVKAEEKAKQREHVIGTKQLPLDNPVYLAEAMNDLQNYCPISFDDPGLYSGGLELAHLEIALAARTYVQRVTDITPEHNIVRQMFLNCWALSVYNKTTTPTVFYKPILGLSPYLSEILFDENENFIFIFKKPPSEVTDDQ